MSSIFPYSRRRSVAAQGARPAATSPPENQATPSREGPKVRVPLPPPAVCGADRLALAERNTQGRQVNTPLRMLLPSANPGRVPERSSRAGAVSLICGEQNKANADGAITRLRRQPAIGSLPRLERSA